MRQGEFYFYQVLTGNLSRTISHISEYEMLIESYKKTENLDEEGKEHLLKMEIDIENIKKKRDVYLKIKEKLDNKYFGKYFKPSLKDKFIQTVKIFVEKIKLYLNN